jgi:myosin heavy subunit
MFQSNLNGVSSQFDPETVSRQIKSLQVFETVHLLRSGKTTLKNGCFLGKVVRFWGTQMQKIVDLLFHLCAGYTHRMPLIPFAQRYFVQDDQLSQTDALEIAQSYQKLLSESKREHPDKILYIGRKHVFLR